MKRRLFRIGAIIFSCIFLLSGVAKNNDNVAASDHVNLEINVQGAVSILPSRNGKLHYIYNTKLFTVNKNTSENGNV